MQCQGLRMRNIRLVENGGMEKLNTSLEKHFEAIKDPRRDYGKKHPLKTILILGVIGVIGGANDWVGIERFCRLKQEWLQTLVDVPNGIPSHDTFRRVFSLLPGRAFETCFTNWARTLVNTKEGDTLAVDGKTMRGSHDHNSGQGAIELVSVWSTAYGLTIAQETVPEGSNEIATVPDVLSQLDLKGRLISVDAANCQTANSRIITEGGGDYVFALKDNQKTLHALVQAAFEAEQASQFSKVKHETCVTRETAHGRTETRTYTLLTELEYLNYFNPQGRWWRLGAVARVERTRQFRQSVQTSVHYFITSLSADVHRFAKAVRNHWSIENRLHWQLDFTFNEDRSRARIGFQPENLSLLKRFALNLLRLESSVKDSLQGKRIRAAIDNSFMLSILSYAPALNL